MSSVNTKFSTGLFVSLFLLFFLFLRVYYLGYSSLWIDEGYSINASLSILKEGLPILGSGEFYGQGLLYNYITAGLMSLFSFDAFSPTVARIPAVFFGVLSIVALFIFAKKLFNKNVALLSSFLLGFSTWHIAWSQQARGYTGLQFFIIFSFYFLYVFLKDRKPAFLLFFTLSFLGAYLSHTMAIVFIPAYVIILLASFVLTSSHGSPKKEDTPPSPLFSRIKNFFNRTLGRDNRTKEMSYQLISSAISFLVFSYIIYISFPSIKVYGLYENYLAFVANEMLLFAIIFVTGIILGIFSKKYFWSSLFLTIAFFFPLLLVLEYGSMAHMRYLFPIFPFAIIFFSYTLLSITSFIFSRTSSSQFKSFPLLLSFALAVFFLFPHLTFLPQKHYPLKWGSPQPNFKEVYSIIEEERKEGNIVISPYAHLSKIYLEDRGVWFPISLTGRETDVEKITERGVDYYTGAPLIESKEHFIKTLNNESGFVVLDMMATIRIRNQLQEENLIHPKIEEIYQSGRGLDAVWLYKF